MTLHPQHSARRAIGISLIAALLVLLIAVAAGSRAEPAYTALVVLVPEHPIDTTVTTLPPVNVVETWRTFARGQASFYGAGFSGRQTANGETFDPGAMTAAHKTLPFGTRLRVTNVRNGKSVVVRVNDRGPYVGNRILDLSHGAASKIGMVTSGTAPVKLEVLA